MAQHIGGATLDQVTQVRGRPGARVQEVLREFGDARVPAAAAVVLPEAGGPRLRNPRGQQSAGHRVPLLGPSGVAGVLRELLEQAGGSRRPVAPTEVVQLLPAGRVVEHGRPRSDSIGYGREVPRPGFGCGKKALFPRPRRQPGQEKGHPGRAVREVGHYVFVGGPHPPPEAPLLRLRRLRSGQEVVPHRDRHIQRVGPSHLPPRPQESQSRPRQSADDVGTILGEMGPCDDFAIQGVSCIGRARLLRQGEGHAGQPRVEPR